MSLNCENINLKKGSQGIQVKELQTILRNKGYYTAKIDGIFGDYTLQAVLKYQKDNKLLPDGIVGPVTCTMLNSNGIASGDITGRYISTNHHEGTGCNKKGQCNSKVCGPHSIRQSNSKKDIDAYLEMQIAGWAGTTSAGTSHNGIQTALYEVGKRAGYNIKLEWKNFSDMGKTLDERYRAIGKLIEKPNVSVIWHDLYRSKYGHYEVVKEINMNNKILLVLNSLGNSCGSGTYCGYTETRSFSEMAKYLAGISQKSILIVTYEKK